MRYGRVFFGIAIILFAVWVIVGEQITAASSNAVVNARLSTVRAPIAGTVDMPRQPLGVFVADDDPLATITDPLVDRVRLDDLRMEQQFAIAEIGRLVAFGAVTAEEEMQQTGAYDPETLAYRAPRTDTRIGTAAIDVYLTEARQRLDAIKQRIADEAARVGLLANARLAPPADARLWEVLADDGETVQRGQDVAKLVLCDSVFVTLSVPNNVYNRLQIGQKATFRLDGSDMLYDSTITRLAGAGAATIYRNLAIAPSMKHLERFDVALRVPELRDDPDLQCSVGQTGRVFFENRPLDWVRGLIN